MSSPGSAGRAGTGRLPVLATLALWTLRNRALRWIRRLRDPRYAVAFLVGLLYFGWIFVGQWEGAEAPPPTGLSGPLLQGARALAPLGLAALVAFWWLHGGYRAALAFSPAEVSFLFPAPLTRGALLRYKLLKLQGGLVASAVLFGLVPVSALPGPLRMVSAWLLLTTLFLHQLGSSLVRSAAPGSRRRRLPHFRVPVLLLGLAAAGLAWGLVASLPGLLAAGSAREAVAALVRGLEHPAPRTALLPFRLVLAPILASGPGEWVRSLPGALGLLGAHYLWVVRTDVAFEEVAADAGSARARGRAGSRRRAPIRRRLRLPLSSKGPPATAVLWKNATAFLRETPLSLPATVALAAVALFGGTILVTDSVRSGADVTAAVLAGVAAVGTLFGPLALRHDLRGDLDRVELLRTWPLSGPRLAAAEVGASALCLTAAQALLLLGAAVLVPFGSLSPSRARLAIAAAAASPLLLLPLNVLTVTVQNLLAVLFPSWVRIGGGRSGGIDRMGRSLIDAALALLFLAAALLPPLLLAGAVGAVLAPVGGGWSAASGGLVAVVALAAEGALLVLWLGRRLDALEPDVEGLLP